MEQTDIIPVTMRAEFSQRGISRESPQMFMRFEYNDIIVDTAYTFDAAWETAIFTKGGLYDIIILDTHMDFNQALAAHGKAIAAILSGKRRFRDISSHSYKELKA